jgi:hypothetical protein
VKELLRAMRKLRQEVSHPLFDLRLIFHPAMQLEHVLVQPAPQLLNRIEPGGIGGQPHRAELRPRAQSLQHVGMDVNIPAVLNDIDPVGGGIGLGNLPVELADLLAADDIAIQEIDLSGQGIERANGAPLLIVAGALRHRRLQASSGRDFRPAPIAKLIQK